jgi:N-acetylglucosaminyl-diphospho-decaprenol L-rhamnosyltransferase
VPGLRILIVSYSGAAGGAERVLLDLADGLSAELTLACPPGPLARQAEADGVRVFELASRSARARGGVGVRIGAAAALAGHRRELRQLAAALAPDVCVLWGARSALAGLLHPLGRPPLRELVARIVVAHHDFTTAPVVRAALVRACVAADAVVVPSRAVAADLDPRGTLARGLSVVHPGVAPGKTPGAPDQPPVVVTVGALVAWKRPELALEALAVARRQLPELRLRLVGGSIGDGEGNGDGAALAERLRERAAAADLAGAVELVGPSTDVAGELARATCLLHCAEREPFGLVVAEALAAGRPAVVPDAAGPAEIVDCSCGVRYPPGDAAAAGAAIAAVCAAPERARALGEAGRERAATAFARERMVAEFERILSTADGVDRARGRRDRTASAYSRPVIPALVTVAHNSEAVLPKLLASARRFLPAARVIVVDCGSADGSLEVARAAPNAVAVDAGSNLGFGRGCNLGLASVTEPVTVFVNPDVELIDDSLLRLAEALQAPSGADRLLAPLVLSPDGSREQSVHPAPGTPAELVRVLVPPRSLPARAGLASAPWRADSPRRVGWAVGCAVAGQTATLRRLGPFSERIFMYGEDLELGLRGAAQGVETWWWPSARVVHAGAHSTGPAYGGEPFDRVAAARHAAIAMAGGERAARRDDLAQLALFAGRVAAKSALRRDCRRERRQLAAVRRLRRGPAQPPAA